MGTNTYLYDKTTGLTEGYVAEVNTDLKGNVTTKVYDNVSRLKEVKDGTNPATVYEYL